MINNLFTGHLLTAAGLNVLPRVSADNDWIFGAILFICLLIAWVRVNYARSFVHHFKAITSNVHYTDLVREVDLPTSPDAVVMNSIFILSLSLFSYLVSMEFGLTFSNTGSILFFFKISLFFFCLYALKTLILKLTGRIFIEHQYLIKEYLFNVSLFHKLMGIILLPCSIFVTYSVFGYIIALYLGMGVIVLLYLTRLYRGIFILRRGKKINIFYSLLALLIMEILPLMIIIKVFSAMT